MISDLTFKFGKAPGLPAEALSVTPVTVFVGPNNSGKSKVLTEISQYCRTGTKDAAAVILDELAFTGVRDPEDAIAHLTLPPPPGELLNLDHIWVGARGNRQQLHLPSLLGVLRDPKTI